MLACGIEYVEGEVIANGKQFFPFLLAEDFDLTIAANKPWVLALAHEPAYLGEHLNRLLAFNRFQQVLANPAAGEGGREHDFKEAESDQRRNVVGRSCACLMGLLDPPLAHAVAHN